VLVSIEGVRVSGKHSLPSKENIDPKNMEFAGNTELMSAEVALGKEGDPPPVEFVRRGSLPLNHGEGTGMTLRHKRTQSAQKAEIEQNNVNICRYVQVSATVHLVTALTNSYNLHLSTKMFA
jgi:hypothetical protein